MKILVKTICITLLLFVSLSQARVKYVPIADMPNMADFIIVGTVIDSSCRWDEKGVMIYTDYTIEIEKNIKGSTPPQIVLSFAGGTVDDKTIIVTDTPVLAAGEKYVLFAYENNKYSVPTVGHEQGIFRVVHDNVKKQDFVVDYNWYQLEITDEGKIIRGPLTRIDNGGALVKNDIALEKIPATVPQPVIRDVTGQEIPQDSSVFTKPKIRKRGVPITKLDFIGFIKTKAQGKEIK